MIDKIERNVCLAAICVMMLILGTAAHGAHESNQSPNDPFFSPTAPIEGLGQWGLRQVRAEQAWHRTTGAGAVIAVIDTGVDLHEDLAGRLLPGRKFVNCGSQGCPNSNGQWEESPDPQAVPEHGTHVAGIAAAATENGKGVAGVAPSAMVLPINIFDGAGASSEDLAHAVNWAVANGADVINLSLGDTPGVGQLALVGGLLDDVEAALAGARAAGVVVVAAAGNETFPLCDYPAYSEGVICVRATDSKELPADYSNFPIKPQVSGGEIRPGDLTVSAPGGGSADYLTQCGGGIVSTVPAGKGQSFCKYDQVSPELSYAEFVGTSMAAPHVSGVAALLSAMGCDGGAIVDLITSTARHPLTGDRGQFSPDYGYGIVDAAQAAEAAACRVAPADFNADGKTDVSVYREQDGVWYLKGVQTAQWGGPGDKAVPADYNGDGAADIAVFRPSIGTWYLKDGPSAQWGAPGDIPVPADYDGDGDADMAVYRPSDGVWYLKDGPSAQWGAPGDIPVPADYNGDGAADIAVFRPSIGTWYLKDGPSAQWGAPGDIPVPADYDGDGDADMAVFRPDGGNWFVLGGPSTQWGAQGDIPVPGYYDGDQKTDMAVFRPQGGAWFVKDQFATQWGASGDKALPLPSAVRD